MDLKDKVAIITGGNSGIGKRIAFDLAELGATTVIAGRRASLNEETANEIQSLYGVSSLPIQCDVTQEADCTRLISHTTDHFGALHLLINNAGKYERGLMKDATTKNWDDMIKTNLYSAFFCAREGFNAMSQNQPHALGQNLRGYIFNISSICGVEAYSNQAIYCASKFGMTGLNDALAEEGKEYNIKVTAICPNWVATPLADAADALGPMPPSDVSSTVKYCLSLSPNCWMTRVTLPLR